MGYKTIKLEELDQRVAVYWIPSDYDPAAAADQLASLARRWPDGFVRLTFDDETQVLTSVDYRFQNGAFQSVWTTGQRPADVIAAPQGAQSGAQGGGGQSAAGPAATFDEMWQTYQGWNEFVEFARATYMAENTDFLVAVYDYDQSPSAEKYQEILDKFIREGAESEVHIDQSTIDTVTNRAPGEQFAFAEAREEVVTMLRDMYPTKFLPWYRTNYG